MQPFMGESFHSREWIVSLQRMNRPSSRGGRGRENRFTLRGESFHLRGCAVSSQAVHRVSWGNESFHLSEWIFSSHGWIIAFHRACRFSGGGGESFHLNRWIVSFQEVIRQVWFLVKTFSIYIQRHRTHEMQRMDKHEQNNFIDGTARSFSINIKHWG